MTINGAIAAVSIMLALSLLSMGCLFIWQAATRKALFTWPVSALFALGIVPLMTGTVFAQQVYFRLGTPPYPMGSNEWGTLVLRSITTAVVLWKLVRVWRGNLLTGRDRARIGSESYDQS